jgi:polysaccharide export outer membrane protein
MTRWVSAIAAVAAMGTFAGAAHAQALAAAALRAQTAGASAAPATGDYKIGPEDTIEINVFQLTDLNRTLTVDSSGRILLPLVGQMTAAGRTSEELSSDIAGRLAKSYVNNPQVTVIVKDAQGQRITVDGAVAQPGVYALTGPTTLMQAVALAKGADTKLANIHKVTVFRTVGQDKQSNTYDLALIREGKRPDPVVYGKDLIVVDTSGGRSFLRDLGTAAPIASALRWGY